MKKLFYFVRDSLLAASLFFGGMLLFVWSWPNKLGVLAVPLVFGGLAVGAKILVEPFASQGVLATYRRYFPETVGPLEYRRLSSLNRRFGFFCMLMIPVLLVYPFSLFFRPEWLISADEQKADAYWAVVAALESVGLYFYARARYLLAKGKSQTKRRLSQLGS